MNIQLIVLDLDGTLLNNQHHIDKETKDFIINLNDNIKVVIATGRTYTAAKRYHNELNLKTPLISCNGAFIYNPIYKETIFGHSINKANLNKIFNILLKNNTFFQFYTADTIYSTEIKYLLDDWINQNKHLSKEDKINIAIIDNPINTLNNLNQPIFKVLAIEENKEKNKKLLSELKTLKNIENGIDIMTSNINKGAALEFVANYLKIPISQTLAIGDNNNDASMLKKASIGIAMENATILAKKNADYITTSNEFNGVINALKKHIK
jgi:Cof subfamily protein (haloacid dehalogenase superfamily)